MPRIKDVFKRTKTELEKRGVETGSIRKIGQWRAVYGSDSNNTSAVIPVSLDLVAADLFIIYWPYSDILAADLWEYGQGGGSEVYRTGGYSYTNYASVSTIKEIAKDVRLILEQLEEDIYENLD